MTKGYYNFDEILINFNNFYFYKLYKMNGFKLSSVDEVMINDVYNIRIS